MKPITIGDYNGRRVIIQKSYWGPPGTLCISADARNFHVSEIHFRIVGQTLEICGMHTMSYLQRTGYATALFTMLLKQYPHVHIVTTSSATPKGRKWLLKQGFSAPLNGEDWMLIVKK